MIQPLTRNMLARWLARAEAVRLEEPELFDRYNAIKRGILRKHGNFLGYRSQVIYERCLVCHGAGKTLQDGFYQDCAKCDGAGHLEPEAYRVAVYRMAGGKFAFRVNSIKQGEVLSNDLPIILGESLQLQPLWEGSLSDGMEAMLRLSLLFDWKLWRPMCRSVYFFCVWDIGFRRPLVSLVRFYSRTILFFERRFSTRKEKPKC